MKFTGGEVLAGDRLCKLDFATTGGRLVFFDDPRAEGEMVDISGCTVLPGFLDLHTHGAAGVDVNAADAEGLRKIGRFFASCGVTGWLCSILTDTPEQTIHCIEQAGALIGKPYDGANLLGIHLEGPCLCSEYKGAMPTSLLMQKADVELFSRYQKAAGGQIRYVTISPEVEGAIRLIEPLQRMGMVVAIGHSGADYRTAMEAIAAGARSGTHVGNAMRLFHQHEPAIFGALLETDAYCEAICDGRHLHPGAVRLLLKAKGWERILAITDSIMAAGMPDGRYKLGVNDVEVIDGDARLAGGGARAGSTLTMAQALRNLMEFTGEPLAKCSRLLSTNQAEMMGWRTKGALLPESDADLTVLDADLNVRYTVVGGRLVYAAPLAKREGK